MTTSDRSNSEYDSERITEKLRQRHIECISPLPVKYKESYKRQVLLISKCVNLLMIETNL